MTSQKVMLVNLPWAVSTNGKTKQEEKVINRDSKLGLEHVGLLYLETLLEDAGIPTEVCDLAFGAYHQDRIDIKNFIERVQDKKPAIVGFSPYFTSIEDTFYVAEQIKRNNPKIKVILGGSHASHTANEILEDKLFIDTIFLGEAFETIVPGIEALLQNRSLENVLGVAFRNDGRRSLINGNITNNGWGTRMPLDNLPIPRRSDEMYGKTKTASMMFSMGCPAACTFCSAESLRDKSWRSRSAKNLTSEIEYLIQQFGVEVIETHSDDAFGLGTHAVLHYTDFARRLIDGNYNIRWRSVLRATDFREDGPLLNDNFWGLLRQSGLERVYIGFESGTNERLRKIRKPATVEHNLRAFTFLMDRGIAVQYGFIMFFPDSTTDEIKENQDFLYQLRNVSYSNCSSSLIIHPGSACFDTHKLDGKLKKPYYGSQAYEFSDVPIRQIHDAYRRFVRDQQAIDTLCNDVAYARVWGQDEITHLGHVVKVNPAMLERRAKDLHLAGRKVLHNPEDALAILGEFNERWKNEYRGYLEENARAT